MKKPNKEDICPKSQRVDGKGHSFVFDGDDPYVVCAYCKERRDAISGQKIEQLTTPSNTFKERVKREIRKLLRTSNDALDTSYIKDSSTGKLFPVPKGNSTEDSYYNLALIEAERAIDAL